jgi:hypothetical protein
LIGSYLLGEKDLFHHIEHRGYNRHIEGFVDGYYQGEYYFYFGPDEIVASRNNRDRFPQEAGQVSHRRTTYRMVFHAPRNDVKV